MITKCVDANSQDLVTQANSAALLAKNWIHNVDSAGSRPVFSVWLGNIGGKSDDKNRRALNDHEGGVPEKGGRAVLQRRKFVRLVRLPDP